MNYFPLPKKIFVFISVIIFFSEGLFAEKNFSSVEIILSSDNSIYEQSLYGIQSVIEREVRIRYVDIISSENISIENYFQDLENSGVPLVITIGAQATKLAKENLRKTPIIFSMVSNPKALGLGQDNLCGVTMDISVEEFFIALKDINPGSRNVVAFYSSDDSIYSAEEGVYLDLKHKIFYKPYKIKPEEFETKLDEIRESVDAFFVVSDPLYNQSRFEYLSRFSKENGIILMTTFPTLVKVGSTFSISPSYSKIGVETGLMANRLLNNTTDCKKESIVLPGQSSFYLNEDYSKESGINIPPQIIERAKLTKLFSAGFTLLNEDKLKAAKKVFEAILKKDPENNSAQTYHSLVMEKLTGTKTRELLSNANKYFESKDYAQAKNEYQKVLSINPNNQVAKEGFQKSLVSQSEMERAKGNSLERSGNMSGAIKMYLSSLRTWNGNQRASLDLANLRKTESLKIPEYLKEGISYYNARNYDKSIVVFEDILLIDPSEKSAKEYLRLSYKKKEAIQILQKKLGKDKK